MSSMHLILYAVANIFCGTFSTIIPLNGQHELQNVLLQQFLTFTFLEPGLKF